MNIDAPSLHELDQFLLSNRQHFDEDEHRCIASYLSDINQKYSSGKYWLKGQLEMTLYEKITNEKINKAIEIDNQNKIKFGGPCNSFELASINQSNSKFEHLQKVLQKYYDILQEEYFRPPNLQRPNDNGGIFYQEIAKNTLVGK